LAGKRVDETIKTVGHLRKKSPDTANLGVERGKEIVQETGKRSKTRRRKLSTSSRM
jgi:hypothetical protein